MRVEESASTTAPLPACMDDSCLNRHERRKTAEEARQFFTYSRTLLSCEEWTNYRSCRQAQKASSAEIFWAYISTCFQALTASVHDPIEQTPAPQAFFPGCSPVPDPLPPLFQTRPNAACIHPPISRVYGKAIRQTRSSVSNGVHSQRAAAAIPEGPNQDPFFQYTINKETRHKTTVNPHNVLNPHSS